MRHVKASLAVAAALFLLVVAFASPAVAHGGDPDLVHSCVKSNGTIRIIAPNGTCNVNETPLDWGLEGPEGTPGPKGDPGADGTNGTNGVSGYQVITQGGLAGPGQTVEDNIACPTGKKALGGGVRSEDAAFGKFLVRASAPDPLNNFAGWIVQVTNQDGANRIFTLYVVCATVN